MHILRVRNGVVSASATAPIVCTLGSFDGVHKGHRSVLSAVVKAAEARGCIPALMTFIPHPSVALGKIQALPLITTLRQRVRLLEEIGIEELVLVSFTKVLAGLTWREFCDLYIRKLLSVQQLIIGPDARVGKKAEGTAPLLKEYLEPRGCDVTILPFVSSDDKKIASRSIREAIAEGRMEEASALLGRYFTYEGLVVHGDGRGSAIGFPTANIASGRQVVPSPGVYCGHVEVDGKRYEGVCNIGVRPTFNGSTKTVEVHLITQERPTLYGKRIAFSFVARLRDEIKFPSVVALTAQIAQDITHAQTILKTSS